MLNLAFAQNHLLKHFFCKTVCDLGRFEQVIYSHLAFSELLLGIWWPTTCWDSIGAAALGSDRLAGNKFERYLPCLHTFERVKSSRFVTTYSHFSHLYPWGSLGMQSVKLSVNKKRWILNQIRCVHSFFFIIWE